MARGLLNNRYRLEGETGRGGGENGGGKRLPPEAQSAARLNHPNIVSIYDVGETEMDGEPRPFIVMELVEGRRLNVDPPRDLGAVIARAAGAWPALGHAPEDGVIPRGLKPENILLT